MTIVRIIELTDKFQLCEPWDDGDKPVYIQLALSDGDYVLTMDTYQPGLMPVEVHEGVTEHWWGAEPFSDEAANELLAKIAPLVENYFDLSEEERADVDLSIEGLVADVGQDGIVSGVNARDYYAEDEIYSDTDGNEVDKYAEGAVRCEIAGIGVLTTETTDQELEALSDKAAENLADENMVLYDVDRYLKDVRSNLLSA